MQKQINAFYLKGVNGIVEFKRDVKGKVTGVQFIGADGNMFIKNLIEKYYATCWKHSFTKAQR